MANGMPESIGRKDAVLGLADERLMWREVEDEVIVLDKRTWNYMAINGSGALLWKEIARGASTAELVSCLRESYEVDEQTAAGDVDAFLTMLREHDLLAREQR
ncbi:MAG TPA: PqqD family protein [Solirubrobacteraceae bacterium]|nr:PqqD family protein [Solirubrobacteraceae bacterium]